MKSIEQKSTETGQELQDAYKEMNELQFDKGQLAQENKDLEHDIDMFKQEVERKEADIERLQEEIKSYQGTVMRQTRELEENQNQANQTEELKAQIQNLDSIILAQT